MTNMEGGDESWNPIVGCSVVSPGCTNCYAMRMAGTRLAAITRGGTILGTNNRCDPAKYYTGEDKNGEPIFTDVTDRCIANLDAHDLTPCS